MDTHSLITFTLLFIIIGMLSFLYYDNLNRKLKNKTNSSTTTNDPVEVVEYNPYIYYNPYYYDGYPWWWYGSSGSRNYYGDRRIYYSGNRGGYGGHGNGYIRHGGGYGGRGGGYVRHGGGRFH